MISNVGHNANPRHIMDGGLDSVTLKEHNIEVVEELSDLKVSVRVPYIYGTSTLLMYGYSVITRVPFYGTGTFVMYGYYFNLRVLRLIYG